MSGKWWVGPPTHRETPWEGTENLRVPSATRWYHEGMAVSLIINDGGVNGLLGLASLSERSTSEPLAVYWHPSANLERLAVERAACQAQGHLYGISESPERNPIQWPSGSDEFERTCRTILEAALVVRRLGGGEVVWPVNAPDAKGLAGEGPDVAAVGRTINQALLVSQLVSLTAPDEVGEEPRVRIRTPYADLVDRQIADLILDMDLPIWTCWFWSVGEGETDEVQSAAAAERTRWMTVLRAAGWTGSMDSARTPHSPQVVTLPQEVAKPAPRVSGESR